MTKLIPVELIGPVKWYNKARKSNVYDQILTQDDLQMLLTILDNWNDIMELAQLHREKWIDEIDPEHVAHMWMKFMALEDMIDTDAAKLQAAFNVLGTHNALPEEPPEVIDWVDSTEDGESLGNMK